MNSKIILISLFYLIIIIGCNNNEKKEKEIAVYAATEAVVKDTTIFKEYVCQIRSIQHIELRSIEKGYLKKIYVDEGKWVKKGDLLFEILPIIYTAEKEKAQAELNYSQVEYNNIKSLSDSNVVSKNQLALAKAKLEKAQAELNLSSAHLGFTEIKAPFSGMVGRFYDVRLGSLLDEGELLTTLSDNSNMWVYFNVPEVEYLSLSKRLNSLEQIIVKLRMANNQIFDNTGKIETIEAEFNNETGNIAFRANFKNPKGILRNGETGKILMPITLTNALFIPQEATYEVLDKKYVYLIDENNIVHAQEVKIDKEIPYLYTISSGLKPKDKILIDGLRKVNDGDKVDYKLKSLNSILNDLNQLYVE